jgi:2-keto-4-pentenoate hydratase/2-oxohepta-3-ene-1,7-dioic acid hydratase in catechol pathway
MRLLTFSHTNNGTPLIGVRTGDQILDIAKAAKIAGLSGMPESMKALFSAGPEVMSALRDLNALALGDLTTFKSAWTSKESIHYLPPILDADKFLCVGKNYRKHLEELKRTDLIREIPEEPTGFIKLNSCLVGHQAKVVKPNGVVRLDYEPELVFVIGKRALGVKKADAFDYVLGKVCRTPAPAGVEV